MKTGHFNEAAVSVRAAPPGARHLVLYTVHSAPRTQSAPGGRITARQSSQTVHPLSLYHRRRAAIAG